MQPRAKDGAIYATFISIYQVHVEAVSGGNTQVQSSRIVSFILNGHSSVGIRHPMRKSANVPGYFGRWQSRHLHPLNLLRHLTTTAPSDKEDFTKVA